MDIGINSRIDLNNSRVHLKRNGLDKNIINFILKQYKWEDKENCIKSDDVPSTLSHHSKRNIISETKNASAGKKQKQIDIKYKIQNEI